MSGVGEAQARDRKFIDALREALGLAPLYFMNYERVRHPEFQWLGWMDRITMRKPAQTPQRRPR